MIVLTPVLGGGLQYVVPLLAEPARELRADQAGPADDDNLHDFPSLFRAVDGPYSRMQREDAPGRVGKPCIWIKLALNYPWILVQAGRGRAFLV